ncbi:nicotinate (nicotinamide) nucleotide adenylyltransferase [bacterium]|nr:nicotinate (nicotinamide) nucleotide adenylyltransferase [bacterium]
MKICLYQGTFNPPHLGHLQVAKFVYQSLQFDKIIFIPAHKPPHKNLQENEEESFHRLNMTKFLINGYPYFEVSDIEFQRNTPSYTYITIKELYKRLKLTEKPYFIIGDDAFIQIEKWYHSENLKEIINFIVLPRNNDYDENIFDKLQEKGYNYIRLNMHKIDISSTQIREFVKIKKSIKEYTTKEVEKYIYDNNLYKNDDR